MNNLQTHQQRRTAAESGIASLQNKIAEVAGNLPKTLAFLTSWELVMLVSFTEAYLEDVLILLVQKNPDWMQDSTQSVSYPQLLRATSLPEILERMRRRWAKNIISGTPTQWLERLRKFGATGYASELGKNMKDVWDKRNLVVHSAGASALITSEDFQAALDVINAFIHPTDKYLMRFTEAIEAKQIVSPRGVVTDPCLTETRE